MAQEPEANCDGNSYCCPGMAGTHAPNCSDGKNTCHDCTQHNAAGDPMVSSLFGGFEGMKALVQYGQSKNVSMGWYLLRCMRTFREIGLKSGVNCAVLFSYILPE